jgi:protein-S-isoprenylcysteine O-methyltransferase Ste14
VGLDVSDLLPRGPHRVSLRVARIWLARGAVVPFLLIVVAAWIFSAPWAAANGKFTSHDWAVWFLVLMGCALVALLLAWLMERRSQKMVVTFRP